MRQFFFALLMLSSLGASALAQETPKGLPEPKDAAVRERERRALTEFYEALGGPDWRNLLAYLPHGLADERLRRSALAAHVAASLELARAGVIELNQASPFGPIYIRRKR